MGHHRIVKDTLAQGLKPSCSIVGLIEEAYILALSPNLTPMEFFALLDNNKSMCSENVGELVHLKERIISYITTVVPAYLGRNRLSN